MILTETIVIVIFAIMKHPYQSNTSCSYPNRKQMTVQCFITQMYSNRMRYVSESLSDPVVTAHIYERLNLLNTTSDLLSETESGSTLKTKAQQTVRQQLFLRNTRGYFGMQCLNSF